MKLWKLNGTGLVAHKYVPSTIYVYVPITLVYPSAYDVALKLRPNANDLEELGPEFSTRWKFFESNPDKSIALLATCAGYGAPA